MISIKDIDFSYGKAKVLENISLNLEQGKIYGLLGENGVGKTTLLTLVCGLKKVQYGSITIDGLNPYDRLPQTLGTLYYLPDEVAAIPQTPMQFCENYGKFWPLFDKDKFIKVMEEFGNPVDHRMDKMSNGQLKKTYISFALATNALYMLMDEPTNGLDIPSKAQFRSAVTKLTSEQSTLVISTHQVRDLENIIDPIIILDSKEVLLCAGIDEISQKLYFDYGNEIREDALYSELLPGARIQVVPNVHSEESKVNIEALFNAVRAHKEEIKSMFSC